jgi:hypothetical protein
MGLESRQIITKSTFLSVSQHLHRVPQLASDNGRLQAITV